MNATTDRAEKTHACLTAWIHEIKPQRAETISAARLASEYGAPEAAKQPKGDLSPVIAGGRRYSITRTHAGGRNGPVVWLARPLAE